MTNELSSDSIVPQSEKDMAHRAILLKFISDEKEKGRGGSDLERVAVEELTDEDIQRYRAVFDFLREAHDTKESLVVCDEMNRDLKSQRDSLPQGSSRHHFIMYLIHLLNPWYMRVSHLFDNREKSK